MRSPVSSVFESETNIYLVQKVIFVTSYCNYKKKKIKFFLQHKISIQKIEDDNLGTCSQFISYFYALNFPFDRFQNFKLSSLYVERQQIEEGQVGRYQQRCQRLAVDCCCIKRVTLLRELPFIRRQPSGQYACAVSGPWVSWVVHHAQRQLIS